LSGWALLVCLGDVLAAGLSDGEAMRRTGLSDLAWSSEGMPPPEALRRWQALACEAITPMEIRTPAPDQFAARWTSHAVGPLRLVALTASPLSLAHPAQQSSRPQSFQLVYCRRTPMVTRVGGRQFRVEAGQFVLLDNAQPYDMRMDGPHQAVDLVMPGPWLERWLADPGRWLARPMSACSRWGSPLGAFLTTMAEEIGSAALARGMLADQMGPLLALAVEEVPGGPTSHKARLAARALQLIRERLTEPDLSPGDIAAEMGVSRRYLHAILTEAGATFTGALALVRLELARQLLCDRRHDRDQIAEIAWRCGYPDPAYFSRVFRRRFGMGPRAWRDANRG